MIPHYNNFNINKTNSYIKKGYKILDVGAGTGAYSKALTDEGYDVTAVELVKHNLKYIENLGIECYQVNAIDLSRFKDNSFDMVLLFGPMYHLLTMEEKVKALEEAKRVSKKYIFISYCMNEFALIYHGFIEGYISEDMNNIDDNFKILKEYIKEIVNKMDEETYNTFIEYHLSTCEREELLGVGRHILDILDK